MVISISPGARDEFNDLTTLKIKHKKGIIETPNRLVNRYDLNAKNAIGADIPLTRASKSFLIQESFNENKLELVLTKNGYLGEILNKLRLLSNKVGTPESLSFLYTSLTKDALPLLDTDKKYTNYARFCCNLASELGFESIILPIQNSLDPALKITNRYNLQLIPLLDIKEDTALMQSKFDDCMKKSSSDIPLIAYKFATYPTANKGYDYIMDNFNNLHENNQGIMMVDMPRMLYQNSALDVSTPHYSSFLAADLFCERYTGGGGGPPPLNRNVRLFCKNDLITAVVDSENNKFDFNEEKEVFHGDTELQALLKRISRNETTDRDWKDNRAKYLSRVHENVRTRSEFKNMKKNIEQNDTAEYLLEKPDMNTVVKDHIKKRLQR